MPARKGQPNLTNDPGKRGGWEYRAVHGVNKIPYSRGYYQAGISWFIAARRAAKSRNMSVSAYLRRAVAAFAARDLDMDFAAILKDSPSPGHLTVRQHNKPGETQKQVWAKEFDDGTGFGSWEVK